MFNIIWWIIFSFLALIMAMSFFDYQENKEIITLYNAEKFKEIVSMDWVNTWESLHNIWNSFFELYKQTQDIWYLEKSISAFSWSLAIKENIDTRYNYTFVKSLLESWSDDQQEEEKSSDSSEQSISQSWSWSQSDNSQQEQSNWDNSNQQEVEVPEEDSLSSKEREAIEKTIEDLKKSQSEFQQFFQKTVPQNNLSDLMQEFMWWIDRWWEKDW